MALWANNTKHILLHELVSKPGYGLELIERVRERTQGAVKLLQGSVYPALRSLEVEGLVIRDKVGSRSKLGGRPKKFYEITEEGRVFAKEQAETLAAWTERLAGEEAGQ